MRGRERNAEQCICAEVSLVRGSVELDQFLVDLPLFERVPTSDGRRNCFRYAADRLDDAFSAVTFLVAVAQFPRFVLAGACAARNRRASHRATVQMYVHFNSRIPARIQNLARIDPGDTRRRHTGAITSACRDRRKFVLRAFPLANLRGRG